MSNGKDMFLHRFITMTLIGELVDHSNCDKLDNRDENLRVCTKSQNGMNRGIPQNNKTGIKGVCFDKRRKQYRAYIKLQGKHIGLGYYTLISDAEKARRKAELSIFGSFIFT